MNIGEKIKMLRVKNDWQQKDLAQRLIVAQNTVSQYELNTRQPSMDMLKNFSNIFNVPISYFLDDSKPQKDEETIKKEHYSFAAMLVQKLIDEKIITDPDNISEETVSLILNALKMDIKRVQEQENK